MRNSKGSKTIGRQSKVGTDALDVRTFNDKLRASLSREFGTLVVDKAILQRGHDFVEAALFQLRHYDAFPAHDLNHSNGVLIVWGTQLVFRIERPHSEQVAPSHTPTDTVLLRLLLG